MQRRRIVMSLVWQGGRKTHIHIYGMHGNLKDNNSFIYYKLLIYYLLYNYLTKPTDYIWKHNVLKSWQLYLYTASSIQKLLMLCIITWPCFMNNATQVIDMLILPIQNLLMLCWCWWYFMLTQHGLAWWIIENKLSVCWSRLSAWYNAYANVYFNCFPLYVNVFAIG